MINIIVQFKSSGPTSVDCTWPTVVKSQSLLYDIHEKKIYAYPYKEFKAELSERSQVSLEMDYKSTSVRGGMIVFVRDNIERKLVSYVMNIDAATIQ